ncbi:hypothetical protein WJX72_008804 [[Myrmecia] bisecta]|uniref:Uncharacterized protein n=1 Tax=[Myrmecia] bisecta TaxID=41462 RepID=A0AAW1Q4F3_9CHLO
MPASRKHRQALSAWLEASQQLDEQQQARLKSNAPSARQKRGYVEFAQVVKIRKALRKGSRERLMLAFYSMIPPLRWLFATKDGEPYTAKNFSRWCCDTLRKLFGRPLTLTLLRHSYLNSMDWNRLTISDQEELAAAMCHSTEMQHTYRWMKRKRPVGL